MTHTVKLERLDGTPAHPPSFKAAVPNWSAGETISFGPGKMLRVVDVLPAQGGDGPPVLVVQAVSERASSAEL
ncbi:MAG TPA: hypothetical protein VFM83_12395 [Gaiellaceae bacterium]|nr:hypothetical protein [Gaiellaceae bacterium]